VAGEWGAGGPRDPEQGELGAPLGSLERGRLELTGGVSGATLRCDEALAELYSARFQGKPPALQVREGSVRMALRGRHVQLRDLALNPAVPWDVEIAGGAWKLRADLRGLRLGSLTVGGGLSDVTLLLPPPTGTVPL